jgi:hypothetical protein
MLILVAGLAAALLPAAHAAPPGHPVSAGNVTVIQNDAGNTTNSVTTFVSLAINDFRVRGSGAEGDDRSPLNSRGDFPVQIGPDASDDFTNGILMSSVTENGRDNGEGTTSIYCVSMIENQRTNAVDTNATVGAYWIAVNNAANVGAGSSPEYNINVAGAWFPYTTFIGGVARNHGPADELGQVAGGYTNGGAMNQLIGSPGLAIGTNFFDLGSGKSFVTLTNLGIDSRVDGVMLVSGAKNESANFGLCQVNTTNGGWNLFIKDDGQATLTSFEQDPIAFVFIPKTNTTLVSGRFLGNGSIDVYSGSAPAFTVSSNDVGTYELKIPGKSPTNGVLIISAEGGRTINQDNFVSYQLNGPGDGWIIQSRDCPLAGLESPGVTEPVVSFVYIPGPTPGFTVTPTNNLFTSENGDTATFTVVLDKQPTADVTIGVSFSNTAEGTVSPGSLTFHTNDWNVPQAVTITGVDDAVVDGTVSYTIVLSPATSDDETYNGLDPVDVSVANKDNDGGITVAPTSGLVTTEAGGTATFAIHLNKQPTANVTISLTSSDLTEGTVSPSSVTFDTSNWAADQVVTITGVDDFVQDGNINYTIVVGAASSADPAFNGLNPPDVSVVNMDNDIAGIAVSAAGPNGLSVVEGRTSTYTVVLNSQPTANVTANVASSNTAQGGAVSSAVLTFTSLNWSNAQTITVTGADDLVVDGNTAWTITNAVSSTDPLYAALAPIPVLMTTLDNEPVVSLPSGDVIYGIGLAGVGIDGAATITDPNTANYSAGTLTVSLTANGTSDDRLEIRNTGTGTGQIGVSGSTVSYGGIGIGTFAGGTGLTPLVVTFNSSATPAAAQALLRNVTFRDVNTNTPSQNTRTAVVTVAHADGEVGTASEHIRVGLLRAVDFQEGADHGYGIYTGESDTQLREADPNTPYPTGQPTGLFIDWPDAGVHNSFHVLVRFENLFGDGFGQIPTNAVIVSADLTLNFTDSGDGSPLYRMLIPWDATNETWTSMGNGVDQDDIESRSTFDSQIGVVDGSGSTSTGPGTVSVLPDVLAWQAGAADYGWAMPGWSGNTDGTGFSPGEAANIPDRPRLRVLWLPPGDSVASFRQNVNDYTSAADTSIRQNAPDVSRGTVATVFSDWAVSGTSDNEQVLIKFDNIIADGTNQIPPGAQVHAALLDLASVGNNCMGNGGSFHLMLQPWQDTDTWNSLVDGVSADDIKAVSASSADVGSAALKPFVPGGFHTFELTADVQSWVNGARTNYGWVILPWPGGTDGWGMSMSETATEQYRPQLRVYYSTNVTTAVSVTLSTLTWSPSSVQLQFNGTARTTFTVKRATTLGGSWTTLGSAATGTDGKGTFTDNAPLPSAAFYRIFYP